jgi:hypothetical protein
MVELIDSADNIRFVRNKSAPRVERELRQHTINIERVRNHHSEFRCNAE